MEASASHGVPTAVGGWAVASVTDDEPGGGRPACVGPTGDRWWEARPPQTLGRRAREGRQAEGAWRVEEACVDGGEPGGRQRTAGGGVRPPARGEVGRRRPLATSCVKEKLKDVVNMDVVNMVIGKVVGGAN